MDEDTYTFFYRYTHFWLPVPFKNKNPQLTIETMQYKLLFLQTLPELTQSKI